MRNSFLFALAVLVGTPAVASDFHLFYLGGQSNMDGFGYAEHLPEDLKSGVEGVWIFHGNAGEDGKAPDGRGKWAKLQPGHGTGFVSDGTTNGYSNRFGVELSLAKRLRERFPDRKIAFIKYSRGGTSIDAEASAATRFGCWDPQWQGGEGEGKGINQYDHFLATLENARSDGDIDDDGEPDTLIPAGIAWMQGESDSIEPEVAKQYEGNLAALLNRIRRDLGDEKARVAVGRITDWPVWVHAEIVRQAQADFVERDENAELVTSTDDYANSDKWHYDSAGYLDLGKRFADALAQSPQE